jgi:hypothetical protein
MAKKITPLLRFLRALTKEQREAFAGRSGTTVPYLYQLAGDKEPNPRLKLALSLVHESERLGAKVMQKPLTLKDLLVGAEPDNDGTP